MPDEGRARQTFDEERAAEELQELQREIQRARADRERAEAEFDEFLRGFRAPQRPRPSRAAVASQPNAPAAFVRGETLGPRVPADPSPPTPAAYPVRPADDESDEEVLVAAPAVAEPVKTSAPRRPRSLARAPLVLALAVVAVTAAMFAYRARRPALAPSETPPAAATPQNPADVRDTSPSPAATAPPVTQTPAPNTPPPAGVNLEMVTLRPVWVRVTVDGQRTMERELPGGERIPLRAQRTIVIRAGNAGAVAVSRDGGAETPLGREGVVTTREFSVAATRDAGGVR